MALRISNVAVADILGSGMNRLGHGLNDVGYDYYNGPPQKT